MEQKLVEGLKGKPREDRKTLATLMSDIHAGTMLNRENLRNATMRCRVGFGFPK